MTSPAPGADGRAPLLSRLSIDFAALTADLPSCSDPDVLGVALLEALANWYAHEHGGCYLQQFEQSGASYLFDLASAVGLPQEDRTVAAWALTPDLVARRDISYQRGFPMLAAPEGPPVDRGHVIPHLSGGAFGPNIYRQDRALNRGWSEQGKRYRALEREATATPGTLFFGHLLYSDESAYPAEVEVGLMRGTALHVERFDNRPGPAP
jgi:hypothetical protein